MDLIVYDSWRGHTPSRAKREEYAKQFYVPMTVILKDLPSLEAFTRLAIDLAYGAAVTVEAQMGYSLCHPADEYCRKIGRQRAEASLKPVVFEVRSISTSKGIMVVDIGIDGEAEFRLSWEKGRVRANLTIVHLKYRNSVSR